MSESHFTKVAISAGRTLAALQARVAQGARVAPGLMQRAEQAAAQGLASTPAAMRRTALGASESARMGQAAAQMGNNPVTQGMRQRVGNAYEAAMSNPAAVRNMGAHNVVGAADMGATGMSGVAKPYTRAHAESMFTPGAQMTSTPAAATPVQKWQLDRRAANAAEQTHVTRPKGRMTSESIDSTSVRTQMGQAGGSIDARFGAPQAPGAVRSQAIAPAATARPGDTAITGAPSMGTGDTTAVGRLGARRPLAPQPAIAPFQGSTQPMAANPFEQTVLSRVGARR